MNPIQTYNYYIDRYGDKEGRINFIQYCYFFAEVEPFPKCLEWLEIARQVKNKEI